MRVTVSEEGTLLDHLKKMQPSTSNNVLRKMLTNQRVQVDEIVIHRAKHIVQSGQIIEILPRPKMTIEEKQEVMKIIATGGLAPLLQSSDQLFEAVEDNLTMHGLRLIFDCNKSVDS